MRLFVASLLLSLAGSALASPTGMVQVHKANGPTKPGSYIISVRTDKSRADAMSNIPQSNITQQYDLQPGVNGFAAVLSEQGLRSMQSHPDVIAIEEDGQVTMNVINAQTNAPWGLERISQNPRLSNQDPTSLNHMYRYDLRSGANVDIFIIDTGINVEHQEFGGSARFGAVFGGYAPQDGNGHGTHVAGTAGGITYGVAKDARLIAVKVLDDSGTGYLSDVIAALDYVKVQYEVYKRPSIASMSLGGGPSAALDNAVRSLTDRGIHVTVAAGNSNMDAKDVSPARAPTAITVGASNIQDARAPFSNFGSIVDIFAPGVDVVSAWIGSSNAQRTLSGTSMSTPHIAGLVAYLISVQGNTSPAQMSERIKNLAVKNALSGIPAGTSNLLARNNIT